VVFGQLIGEFNELTGVQLPHLAKAFTNVNSGFEVTADGALYFANQIDELGDISGEAIATMVDGRLKLTAMGRTFVGAVGQIIQFNDLAYIPQQALTSSSNAVAWDTQAKPNAYHITTENTTFSAPTNGVEGAFICLEINYNGSHTIGWNTAFEFPASTEPTETATDGKTDIHVFRYNGAIWQEVGRSMNLSES